MNLSLLPAFSYRSLTEITPDFLCKQGVRFLMLDLDNTLAPYSEHLPSVSVTSWVSKIKDAGITLFFVSNSKRPTRVEVFANALETGFIKEAQKPSPDKLLQTIAALGFSTVETALVGDQIYTDVLAANLAGIISIIVRPIKLQNPLLALRFAVETPFRLVGFVKQKITKGRRQTQ